MKNQNNSQPYRNLGFEKIEAPESKSRKKTPNATKTVGDDLRSRGKK